MKRPLTPSMFNIAYAFKTGLSVSQVARKFNTSMYEVERLIMKWMRRRR